MVEQGSGADGLQVELQLFAFEAAQVSEVVDQRLKSLRVPENDIEKALGGFRITNRSVAQRLGKAANRGQRRAELVTRIGHEVSSNPIRLPLGGDVVEHGDDALVIPKRRHRCAKDATSALEQAVELELEYSGKALLRIFDRSTEIRMPNRLDRRFAFGIEADQVGQHFVAERDVTVRVGDHDGFGHGVQNRPQAILSASLLLLARRQSVGEGVERAP